MRVLEGGTLIVLDSPIQLLQLGLPFELQCGLLKLRLARTIFVELTGAGDNDYESWIEKPMALRQIASIAIGVLLCTGASYWTRLLAKFRNLGYEEQEGTKT